MLSRENKEYLNDVISVFLGSFSTINCGNRLWINKVMVISMYIPQPIDEVRRELSVTHFRAHRQIFFKFTTFVILISCSRVLRSINGCSVASESHSIRELLTNTNLYTKVKDLESNSLLKFKLLRTLLNLLCSCKIYTYFLKQGLSTVNKSLNPPGGEAIEHKIVFPNRHKTLLNFQDLSKCISFV